METTSFHPSNDLGRADLHHSLHRHHHRDQKLSNPDSLIYKASKVAIIFRAITAFIALILVPTPFFFMTIDYFAGFFAGVILGFDTHNYSFFETLIWTLFEGLLLSIFLFTIALVILGLMKLREILYRDPTTK